MMEEIGIITAIEKPSNVQYIRVETQIKTTCGGCQANDDCGTGIVAKAFSPKKESLYLICEQEVNIGQSVKLGIPEERLLSASALVYLLPLLAMIGTTLLAQFSLPPLGLEGEGWIIASAFAAALVSFYWLRHFFKQDKQGGYQPRLIAILPWQGESIDFVALSTTSSK